MTFSLKKNRRNTRSYSGSSTPAPSRSTASRPNTRNRAKPAREKRQFSLWSKLQGGRVQRFFCVLFLLAGLVPANLLARIPVTTAYRRYSPSNRLWKQA